MACYERAEMSLVNSSLQNLEARRGEETLSNYAAASIRLGHKETNNSARKSVIVGCLLVGLAMTIYLLQSRSDQPEKLQTRATTQELPNSDQPVIVKLSALIQEPSASEKSLRVHPQSPHAIAEKQQAVTPELIENTVTLLLASAAAALKSDRLITPENTSAKNYYQQALLLQPDNQTAQQGLKNIATRYAELARNQFQKGLIEPALKLIALGLTVEPNDPELLILRSEIEASPEPIDIQNNPPGNTTIAQQIPAASLSVQPSNAGLDNRQLKLAKDKVASGDVDGAIRDLEQLASTGEIGKNSTRLLANLYLQQQRPLDAEKLIQQQTALSQAEAAYLIARAQVQADNLAGALATLESQPPLIQDYPDYYSLLAGIYQQGGQYRQAVAIYKRLSQLQPETYTHWLGLAAGLDSLREPTALAAFRKVLPMIPEQQSELKHYIRQRLEQLSIQ
ncbi:MAG: tetratricopeptide repeat protein [Pseudomonadales bacterium]|nr:tetratricopeptide repeat protein [Pseudomonadales bacterium]MCP5172633.1 tetratricopeptide repeat protein [Pseudomonadales bacterium]MCP5302107.1 tetratricopeptide repeat protein [Pseudomonadales bacterium]